MEPPSLVYKVAPIGSNQSAPHPVLILLHGRGTDENDLLAMAPFFSPKFLILSVRAPFRFPFGGYMWFNMDEMGTPDSEQLAESHQLLLKFLDEIQKIQPVDLNNIFLFGFSMGAMMALELTLQNPKKIKGVVAHSGFILQNEQTHYHLDQLQDTSFFFIQGTRDPIVPVELVQKSYEMLLQANARVQYHEYPIPHTISEESLHDASLWLQDQLEQKK